MHRRVSRYLRHILMRTRGFGLSRTAGSSNNRSGYIFDRIFLSYLTDVSPVATNRPVRQLRANRGLTRQRTESDERPIGLHSGSARWLPQCPGRRLSKQPAVRN